MTVNQYLPRRMISLPRRMLKSNILKFETLSLWRYRGFIIGSIKREFQAKYRGSLLGVVWTIISPLSMILVYTVIFSGVMQAKIPGAAGERTSSYGIYLCAGILAWGFFSEIVSRAQNIFLDNANLLKKISFPRLCLPVIIVLNASINFLIIFALFTAFLVISGNFPGYSYFSLLPLMSILICFSISLGLTLGILNVFFRDVGQLFGICLQFWFWFTPIVYSENILPSKIRYLLRINPMSPIIESFHRVIVTGSWPNWESLIYPVSLSLVLGLSGYSLFRSNIADIMDEL